MEIFQRGLKKKSAGFSSKEEEHNIDRSEE